MPSSNDLHATSTPSILLIGDGGTEKTRLAVTAPKAFVYDFDAGLTSTRDLPEFHWERFKDVPFGSKSHNKADGFYPWGTAWPAWIDHLNDKVWPALESNEWPYETIVIDSLTTLTTQCMNYVLKNTGKTPKDSITLPEWGSQLRLMEGVMEQLSAWAVRLIVTAHIKRDTNEQMATIEFLPMITGQLAGRIGIYFDEVYYTEVEGKGEARKIKLITEATGLYRQAKSRHKVPNGTLSKWSELAKYLKAKVPPPSAPSKTTL